MDELLKFILKAVGEEPIFIVRGIVKVMRTLSTFLIAIILYIRLFDEFELVTDIHGIFEFFVSGAFVKPLLTYVAVVLVFDVILNSLLKLIFRMTMFQKKMKQLDEVEETMKKSGGVSREAAARMVVRVLRKCNLAFMKGTPIELKALSDAINAVNFKRFDITCLIITQWIVLAILFDLNVFLIIGFAVTLVIIELTKRFIQLAGRIYQVLSTEPEAEG